jgi:predicted O-linked N-acetylglucosamine transferase (SPINDLY family)
VSDSPIQPDHRAAARVAQLWSQLQPNPLQPALWLELAQLYSSSGLHWPAAYAAQQASRLDPALVGRSSPLALVIPAAQGSEDPLSLLPAAPEARGQGAAALQRWLEHTPADWLGWLLLARWLDQPTAIRQAQATEPIPGETLHWLGVWRLQAGDAQGAAAALAPLVDLRPQRHGSMLYLGEALLRLGNRTAAEQAFTRASASANPAFLRLLAKRVYAQNYWQEAIAVLQRALDLQPGHIPTLVQLAKLHWEVYDLTAAETLCQQVLQRDPANGDVRYLLNALPGRRGDAAAQLAAVEAHYAALAEPDSRLSSSIAMASLYVDDRSPEQLAAQHRQLCAAIERALPATSHFANSLDPERPLRLGLVSGDFHRQHPVNLFMLPLLERLDRHQFPVTVFHTGTMHDDHTARARQAAHHWIEAGTLDDHALHQRIGTEQIDILIDLAGHTTGHRLGVFALRAAPVQATFLGYPHSTGLSRIDWLIGDPIVSPVEHAPLFSEGIAQLPGSVFCWAPVDAYPLPPPRAAEAPLVFGSFNNVMKLSPHTLRLWSAVLRALPQAQLLLKAPSLADRSVIERFQGLFAAEGIGAERLAFEGPEGLELMMQRYGAIDIALDSTPYNGGTTTLQALWMGVPVIALAGGNFVSRMGASFLTALGRSDWIADTDEAFVAIACRLAEQLPATRKGRTALRQQMAHGGLSDLERYTAGFQQLLRRIWRHHCSGDPSRFLAADTTALLPTR